MTGNIPIESDIPQDSPVAESAPGQAPGTSQQGAPDIASLQHELEAARSDAADNLDKFLRAKAEAENIRRRAETDVANAHKYGIERFAMEMLAVKDSLERARAVEIAGGDADTGNRAVVEKMLEGLDLTLKLMDSIFQKFALSVVDPKKGDKFDPERHQAMSMLESDEVPANHVLATVQRGYLLHERLLRPAMVIVAKARGN